MPRNDKNTVATINAMMTATGISQKGSGQSIKDVVNMLRKLPEDDRAAVCAFFDFGVAHTHIASLIEGGPVNKIGETAVRYIFGVPAAIIAAEIKSKD